MRSHLGKDLIEVRKWFFRLPGERVFQTEKSAKAKPPNPECSQTIGETARILMYREEESSRIYNLRSKKGLKEYGLVGH